MRRILIAIALVTVAGPARADDDFKPLFNGKDMTGWKHYLTNNGKMEDVWSVKDGVIECKGNPAGYILTDKEYGDYVLKLQWRWPEGTRGGNSGVLLYKVGPDKTWPKSVEAQLQHGQAGDFWLIDAKLDIDEARRDPNVGRHFIRLGESWDKTGDKDRKGRNVARANRKSYEKPIGEWNQYEIHCEGNNVKLMINGQLVNEGKNGELSKGAICLQSEGAPVHFRNIEIKSKK